MQGRSIEQQDEGDARRGGAVREEGAKPCQPGQRIDVEKKNPNILGTQVLVARMGSASAKGGKSEGGKAASEKRFIRMCSRHSGLGVSSAPRLSVPPKYEVHYKVRSTKY